MTTIYSWIKKHSVLLYFVLTFGISWGAVLLVIGGPGAIPATPAETDALLGIGLTMMLLGPSVMGLVMTALVHGREGLRNYLSRLLKWRVGARWYVVVLLAIPLLPLVTLLALWLTSPVFLPGIFAADDKLSRLLTGITIGLAAGIFEELGWTGFAIPQLRRHYSVVATGLIVGFLWGAWHYLVAFWASGDANGAFLLSQFVLQMSFYVAVLPAFRVLMVWVYEYTESLLLAMLMHASLTGGVLFFFMPLAISWVPLLTWYVVMAAVMWLAVAAIAFYQKEDTLHGRPPTDQMHSQAGGQLPQHS